jgi:hypothetical protein
MTRIPRYAAAFLLALLGAWLPLRLAATADPEDELKAAVVLSFLRYAEFTKPLASGAPLAVCVVGREEFTQTLRRTIEGKLAGSHAVSVAEFKPTAPRSSCRLLYAATSRKQEIQDALSAPGSAGALTIGESDRFLELGGAVNLVLVDGRVGFQVDLDSLRRAGVEISSKLLRFGQLQGGSKGASR